MTNNHYCVFTQSPHFIDVVRWISDNNVPLEVHANRTRFWVPDELFSEFQSTWDHACSRVHDNEDLATGINWDEWKASKDLA